MCLSCLSPQASASWPLSLHSYHITPSGSVFSFLDDSPGFLMNLLASCQATLPTIYITARLTMLRTLLVFLWFGEYGPNSNLMKTTSQCSPRQSFQSPSPVPHTLCCIPVTEAWTVTHPPGSQVLARLQPQPHACTGALAHYCMQTVDLC